MADAGALVLAVDVNPMDWLGGAAAGVAADGWKSAMVGVWSAGLWLLQLAFKVVDAFTLPDVSATGPLAGALPTTMWLGGAVAVLMLFVQLLSSLVRRDGQGLGRLLLGLLQFGVVWACFLTVDGALIVAAGALSKAILGSLLHVGGYGEFALSASWPRKVDDATAASVLGISSLLLLIPSAFAYLLIMLVREAALVILIATTPISSAGLLAEASKTWFWKSLRWFISCLLIAPAAALILGIGVAVSNGVVQGAGTATVAAAGTAVVGCVLVAVGAVCPMVLFKLLAFVDPGTGSGAALRQSLSDAGGVSGLLGGGALSGSSGGGAGGGAGGSVSMQSDGAGRSQGEATADASTSSRMGGALGRSGGGARSVGGGVGAGVGAAVQFALRAADLASDILGSAGVGDPGYSAGFADNAAKRNQSSGGGGRPGGTGSSDGTGGGARGGGEGGGTGPGSSGGGPGGPGTGPGGYGDGLPESAPASPLPASFDSAGSAGPAGVPAPGVPGGTAGHGAGAGAGASAAGVGAGAGAPAGAGAVGEVAVVAL